MAEKVNHPEHYRGDTPYEAIKVIEAWGQYISRAGSKPGTKADEDIRKAIWYLNRWLQSHCV